MPEGDLWRRLLTCRLDARSDAPERRFFPLEPPVYGRRDRKEIVGAGLRSWLASAVCGGGVVGAGWLGSMDGMVFFIRP